METTQKPSLEGLIYQIAYNMQQLRLFNWTLTRWAVLVLLAVPALMAAGIVPGGRMGAIATGALGLSAMAALWRAKRRGYLRFEPDSTMKFDSVDAQPLAFPQKISLNGSGTFAVGKAARHRVEEPAHYQTFPTRERVVMVNIAWRRHFFLVQSSPAEVGWWYAFFTPATLKSWQAGRLIAGSRPKPALALAFAPEAKPTVPQTIYLSFDSEADMRALVADLLVDCDHTMNIS